MAIVGLDKTTIKQITTTQVITSVFSAVKELVENAIDGGGNHIDVYLEDKGLAFIEIKDNGRGILKVDSVYMAQASYTSKISSMSDLESLTSYGFRGEALNSLCKVSDVKIITRTHEDDHARCYTLSHDGNIDHAEFCNRAIGTTVQARSIFKNFPVRRQIISNKKKSNEDVKLIENLLQEFAICRPKLRINYRVDDVTVFTKIPSDSEEDNLGNVFGRKFSAQYKSLNFSDQDLKIDLMVPKKDLSDLSSINRIYYQHIFVNSRPVVLKEFEKAILKVLSTNFGDKISTRKRPPFFLNITISPSCVDVNLEPNKTSVLLVNNSSIIDIITNLLSEYYEIPLEPPETPEPFQQSTPSSSNPPNDSLSLESDSEVRPPSPKKRKLSKQKSSLNTEDKENMNSNEIPQREEPTSQLPEVNLGEDFSTQEINALPTLNDEQVEALTNSLGSTTPEETNLKITESQWSKGHVPFDFPGGTDVSILNINTRTPEIMNKISSSSNPEANKNGFMKFSKEMRTRLIKSNPDLNLVQIAKLLGESWKGLSSDEREHYRELGMQDESLSRTKLSPSARPKIPKSKDSADNKKRLLSLLECMKEKESSSKKESGKTIVPWEINMQTLLNSFRSNGSKNNELVVGKIDDKLWIARTNMQLWCLDVEKLFEGLNMKDNECEKIPEAVEQCLQRWLQEKDSMDLMHPIFEFSPLKENN